MDPLIRYLIKHINRPTAAVNVFGGTGLIAGAASGWDSWEASSARFAGYSSA